MHETLDELALEDEEDDEQGGDDQQGGRGQQGPLGADLAQLGEAHQARGQRAGFVAVGDHQRPQEFVPVPGHR